MAPSRLREISRNFDLTIRKGFEWIRVINEQSNKEKMKIRQEYVHFSYELAFIKIFVGWEKFLQESFISYMAGAGLVHYKPKLYLRKVNRDHALKILSGTEDYPDWSKIDEVYTLAKLYFVGGRPFTLPLQQIEIHFNEMKKIRNAIVHISSKAKEKFEGLVRAKIANYRSDMCPGEFLGIPSKQGESETFIEYYVSFLEAASSKIVPI